MGDNFFMFNSEIISFAKSESWRPQAALLLVVAHHHVRKTQGIPGRLFYNHMMSKSISCPSWGIRLQVGREMLPARWWSPKQNLDSRCLDLCLLPPIHWSKDITEATLGTSCGLLAGGRQGEIGCQSCKSSQVAEAESLTDSHEGAAQIFTVQSSGGTQAPTGISILQGVYLLCSLMVPKAVQLQQYMSLLMQLWTRVPEWLELNSTSPREWLNSLGPSYSVSLCLNFPTGKKHR